MSRILYRLLIQEEDDVIAVRYVGRNGKISQAILYPSLRALAIVTGMRMADLEPTLNVCSCLATREQFELVGFPAGSEKYASITELFS